MIKYTLKFNLNGTIEIFPKFSTELSQDYLDLLSIFEKELLITLEQFLYEVLNDKTKSLILLKCKVLALNFKELSVEFE